MLYSRLKFINVFFLFFILDFFSFSVFAQAVPTLGTLADNITQSFEAITRLITAMAYVSGAGLFLISIFQFRQHKENPTQIPLSKPMMFLALGAALLFFPTIIQITEHTVFGNDAMIGGPKGLIIST